MRSEPFEPIPRPSQGRFIWMVEIQFYENQKKKNNRFE